MLLHAGGLLVARPIEDRGSRWLGAESGVALVQPVVGEPRAQGMKVVVTPPQGVGDVLQAADIHIAGGRQPLYPRVEDVRKMDVEGLIGTKCRKDARSEEHTSELQSLRHLVCRLLL